jgi:predicted RNA polymerase sigma factor
VSFEIKASWRIMRELLWSASGKFQKPLNRDPNRRRVRLPSARGSISTRVEPAGTWRHTRTGTNELARLAPTPVIALNHAVAVAMREGLNRGLSLIDALERSGELDDYYLFHAARADILRRLGRRNEAGDAYHQALALATNQIERSYLTRRLREVSQQ